MARSLHSDEYRRIGLLNQNMFAYGNRSGFHAYRLDWKWVYGKRLYSGEWEHSRNSRYLHAHGQSELDHWGQRSEQHGGGNTDKRNGLGGSGVWRNSACAR